MIHSYLVCVRCVCVVLFAFLPPSRGPLLRRSSLTQLNSSHSTRGAVRFPWPAPGTFGVAGVEFLVLGRPISPNHLTSSHSTHSTHPHNLILHPAPSTQLISLNSSHSTHVTQLSFNSLHTSYSPHFTRSTHSPSTH